ncbi:MAG: TdeIII family type II restriction endonuclease [Ignavibacterium album]|jgi:type II restriction enzyme|uniref:TdeIII family type II restriction endonuclease n=1 Tax=Ignavibacterium album TaxID=591197 RepID=UPI0026EE52B0|nr:TdeIII family type II restriction endonuclease [Ignavibacterium album]MBI5662985.1 TdeIII family type II restriction endonuclease [Ignavibacterium album]
MPLSFKQKKYIEDVIINSIQSKFRNYKPESSNMPFHYRLLGKDRMALYSFIQSLNTTFGTSIFEPVAVALAKENFVKVEKQYVIGNEICEDTQKIIQDIINNLTINGNPNKQDELKLIRNSVTKRKINKLKTVKVDIFIETDGGVQFLFDLKTVKPNISNFKDFKRTLLEWAGIVYTKNPGVKVNTIIAIPYNPYEPKPYERWTIKGMLDDNELLVGKEFWDFLGGEGAYEVLLDCFESAGIKLRPQIDNYFSKFK